MSLYQNSIPVLLHGLKNMSNLLDKAAAYAEAKKVDPAVIAQLRLYPDMFPLSRQVQIACDTAKGAAGRLAGVEIPKHEDTETTLAELKARVAKVSDFLGSIKESQFAGADSRNIELKFPSGTMNFSAAGYLSDFVLPNFYFHETMVYALLRKAGVEVGKGDYLGNLPR